MSEIITKNIFFIAKNNQFSRFISYNFKNIWLKILKFLGKVGKYDKKYEKIFKNTGYG